MKYFLPLAILAALSAPCRAQVVMDFLTVDQNGVISPAGAVSTIDSLASVAASNVATAVQLEIVAATTASVAAMVSNVTATVDALEGVMYWDGFVLDYGVSESVADTNYVSRILRFDPAVSNDAGFVYSDVYSYFSTVPEDLPVIRFASSPDRDGTWDEAALAGIAEDEVLVGETLFECFRMTVAHPLAYTSAFFRVVSATVYSDAGAFLPVENGISPGGRVPLTGTFAAGTNGFTYVGGLRVNPAE
jgi:hypothetical protein